jgi:hypothetical protein
MGKKSLAMVVMLTVLASLAGCATNGYYDPARTTGVGALGGAGTGAALGSIIGAGIDGGRGAGTGAWVGAATGAILGGAGGYFYAQHQNNRRAGAQTAAQRYNYTPARGNMVDISETHASPASVRPGQQVNLNMAYTVLTPNNAPTTLTIYREVRKDGAIIGQPYQNQVTNYNGTYTDQVDYGVPQNAQPGTYEVVNRVFGNWGSAERVSYFTVI